MGKASVNPNKNYYQKCREEASLTREQAASAMPGMPESRIEKIEYNQIHPEPVDVLQMSEGYKNPAMCNHYCSNDCPIVRKYVPEVHTTELSQIILETLASLNSFEKQKERLIEITVDGKVTKDEMTDFVSILKRLDEISTASDAIKIWIEKTLAAGGIDSELYEATMVEYNSSKEEK